MFSYGFKERHPTLWCMLMGFIIACVASWLYLQGIALFMRAVQKLKEAYYQRPKDYIILFFPDEKEKQKTETESPK